MDLRGKKSKNRDSHLVELIILRLLLFFIYIFIKNVSFTDPRSLATFRPKVACSDVTKSDISFKKIPSDFEEKITDDMKLLCMRRSAKSHVDAAVRF